MSINVLKLNELLDGGGGIVVGLDNNSCESRVAGKLSAGVSSGGDKLTFEVVVAGFAGFALLSFFLLLGDMLNCKSVQVVDGA
jgi:hypothetical protein